jgi:hypothetical protein
MAEKLRCGSLLPLVADTRPAQAHRMLLIHCPVTRTDELVADRRIRSVTNHPTHIALTVACPCGAEHVVRTGQRWERARARVLQRTAAQTAATAAAAAAGSTARAARVGVPA